VSIISSKTVFACGITSATLYIGDTIEHAENHNTSIVYRPRSYGNGWHIHWDLSPPDDYIEGFIWDTTDDLNRGIFGGSPSDRDASGGSSYLHTLSVGPHIIKAKIHKVGSESWYWSNPRTLVYVAVDKIMAYANGSWHDAIDDTFVVLKGTKYTFKAFPYPSTASWPSEEPAWQLNGYPLDPWGVDTKEITFDTAGSHTLRASCGAYDSNSVTIEVIEPVLDEVDYEGGNHAIHDVSPPEYTRDPFQNEPACWTKGADAVAKVKFWYEKDLTLPVPNVIVRAETSGDYWNIGDWHDSAPVTFGTAWPTDEITCVSEATINSEVEYRDYSAVWKYKCLDGTNEWITTTTQNNCRLYVVLDTPDGPQDEPWKEVLDIACDVAWGSFIEEFATKEIWDDFSYNAGGIYDTHSGAPKYTKTPNPQTTGNFDLTKWLSRYKQTPPIGTVNCYDMGKAVSVFANALGCGVSYTYVSSFGYNNCIEPIGCGWTNNPFYDSPHYDDNPMVDGDAADDGILNNHAGRSKFARHAFSRRGDFIYDASVCCVDVDLDPDDGPIHFPYWYLDGYDTWTNDYDGRVIDDNPASSPGTPANYSFDVQ